VQNQELLHNMSQESYGDIVKREHTREQGNISGGFVLFDLSIQFNFEALFQVA
jgi:hypothetical protein